MSQGELTFKHGDGVCGFNCCADPMDCGSCCFTACCPCFSFCTAAQNSGVDDNGVLYAALGFVPYVGNLIGLTMLGMSVEEKRGLKKHGALWHVCCAFFDGCTCHSCRVVAECKLYQQKGPAAPTSQAVER